MWSTKKKLNVDCSIHWTPNCEYGRWMVRQLNGDKGCSWPNQKESLYMTLAYMIEGQTYKHTDRQTDRRSSSRFSAYLFFQRACQTVEKHLMQTENVSECYFLTSSALGLFSFCLHEKGKLSSIQCPQCFQRGLEVRALLCYLYLSTTFSLSLSPCRLFQQCLMEKRWWLKYEKDIGAGG